MAIRNRENVQRPLLGLRKFDEEERQDEDELLAAARARHPVRGV